jgi:hypothetical protein
VLEDRGIDEIPADGSDDRAKYDNVVVQYSQTMAYLREILNHTFMRAVFHTSSRQARLEYQEVQRNFINDHANDGPDDEPVKFTALVIIEYIERECLCSNDKALQSIIISISKMVRYNNQSLLDWLQSFVAPVNKYMKANGVANLDADKAKTIWKIHIAKQIMLSETTLMLLFRKTHLTDYEIRQIKLLKQGELSEKTLQKLVTKLSSDFEPYKPDKAIQLYLNQHTRQLGLEPPSFANPKDKQSSSGKSERRKSDTPDKKRKYTSDRSDKKHKRTNASDSRSKSSSDTKSKNRTDFKKKSKEKGEVPFGQHYRRPECMKRGTHTTHRQKDCRYKDDGHQATYSNLGKAPSKKTEYNSKGAKAQQTFAPSATTTERRCYIYNDSNLSNAFLQRSKHKQNAKQD